MTTKVEFSMSGIKHLYSTILFCYHVPKMKLSSTAVIMTLLGFEGWNQARHPFPVNISHFTVSLWPKTLSVTQMTDFTKCEHIMTFASQPGGAGKLVQS